MKGTREKVTSAYREEKVAKEGERHRPISNNNVGKGGRVAKGGGEA